MTRPAYALLMSLLLLALAAAALAGVARASLAKALAAERAEEELQTRWAMLSCRRALLPQAEALIAEAEERSPLPLHIVRHALTLNGHAIELTLSDEQAKADLNAILGRRGAEAARDAVRDVAGLSMDLPDVRLRPLAPPPPPGADRARLELLGAANLPPLGSWDQVFLDPRPEQIAPGTRRDPGTSGSTRALGAGTPLDHLTLWGGGRLNFRRASPAALRLTCAPLLHAGQIAELVARRDELPGVGLSEWLAPLGLSNDAYLALEQRLTGGSNWHGLWIAMRTSLRTHWQWAVRDEQGGRPRDRVMEW